MVGSAARCIFSGGAAKDAARLEVDDEGIRALDDQGRREFARLLLAIDGDTGHGWRCGLPAFGRALMAKLLLLPAGHRAASSEATDAATGLLQAAPFGEVSKLVVQGEYAKCAKWTAVTGAAAGALVPIPSSSADALGPYAFRTPAELRHSLLPRAHLLARDLHGPFPIGHCGVGMVLLDDIICFSETARTQLPRHRRDLGAGPFRGVDAMWTPGMAPWAVAVAQACGGFPQSDAEYARLTRDHCLSPTPFRLICRALDSAPDIAAAMLYVPSDDAFAVDVGNKWQEPPRRSGLSSGHAVPLVAAGQERAEAASGYDPVARACFESAHSNTLLHLQISRVGALSAATALPLFRRIVELCSDDTLNALRYERDSPFRAVVQYFCHFTSAPRSAESLRGCTVTLEMALILLQRADPDGGGVDLRQRSLPSHLGGAVLLTPCTPHELLVSYRASYDTGGNHSTCWHPHCLRLKLLDDAFNVTFRRQRAFRDGLAAALARATAAARVPGELLALVATYVLHPSN